MLKIDSVLKDDLQFHFDTPTKYYQKLLMITNQEFTIGCLFVSRILQDYGYRPLIPKLFDAVSTISDFQLRFFWTR